MIFYETLIQSSGQHARIWLASLARVLRFALTKIFEKKKCVSIDSKCSETHRYAKKKFLPLWPITRFARSAKPERRSAMKFYNQSDLSSNTSTKFHQNPIHSYRDISFNSRTDRQREPRREPRRERGTDNRFWSHRKTVTIIFYRIWRALYLCSIMCSLES